MSSVFVTSAVVIGLAFALGGCSTPPAATSAPTPAPSVGSNKQEKVLADQIKDVVESIDQILNRYDGVLASIQKLPETKNPVKIFDEVGSYVRGERFEQPGNPTDDQISAGIVESFSFASRLAMTETGIESDLRDLSKKLFSLNARTNELAGSYEQGKTLQNYAGKMRRELMPLMAQLRSLALADTNDVANVAKLDAETQKILTNSRQSLHALEREARNLELELGGK